MPATRAEPPPVAAPRAEKRPYWAASGLAGHPIQHGLARVRGRWRNGAALQSERDRYQYYLQRAMRWQWVVRLHGV